MRLRIDLAYDGSDFHGWARQPSLRTVQGDLEHALHTVLRVRDDDPTEPLTLTVAGRTDAGVHAVGQVCHLELQPDTLDRAVGHLGVHYLPDDLVIRHVSVAPDGFDARFSALERTYVYRIWDNALLVDPRMRSFVLPIRETLDLDAMNEAVSMTMGLHDFGSFATPNPNGTTIRKVLHAGWCRCGSTSKDQDSQRLPAEHARPAPLEQAYVEIGRHRTSVSWFQHKLEHPRREGDTGPISARGLTLEHVTYPPDDALASRAVAIRAKRTL